VTDDELREFIEQLESPMLKAYIKVKYITGQRQQDLLSIRLSDLTDEGIRFTTQKTNKTFILEWTDELREAIKEARLVKRRVGTMYLFATRTGGRYTGSGFRSIWQRAMRSYAKMGGIRFTEHDIRAKTASDTNAEHANEIMRHNSVAFTERVYRRQIKKVRPLK
jgi:integrase